MPLPVKKPAISTTWTFYEGRWVEGNVQIMGVRSHGAWLGSTLFDGARRFEGVAPDLDLHLKRINESARRFGLAAMVSDEEWLALAGEGMAKFGDDKALYIRPMYWAEAGAAGGGVLHDPETTNWCLCIYEAPMPQPGNLAITHSPFRRPSPETAPTDAKAGCLYPNNARALAEAERRGFTNCLVADLLGNIAELGNANIFMVKDGVVLHPCSQRHIPRRNYPPPGDRAAAVGGLHHQRGSADLQAFQRRRRNLLKRQLLKSHAGDAN